VTAPEPVRPGTAEHLARLAQLRWQDTPDAYAADEVIAALEAAADAAERGES
jgi:hypothetical protein